MYLLKAFTFGAILGCILDMYCFQAVIDLTGNPAMYISPWYSKFQFLVLPRSIFGKYCIEFMKKRTIFFPSIEILMGGSLVLSILYCRTSMHFLSNIIFINMLISIAVINILVQPYCLIPKELTLLGILIGFLFSFTNGRITPIDSLLGILLGSGLFYLVALTSKGGMGGGCIKLMAMIGGFLGWEATLAAIFFGVLSGSLVGVYLMLMGKKGRKDPIPFGIFQSIGAIIALFWGDSIIKWYLALKP